MDAITYSAARQNLAQTMNAVCENQKSEPVVLMSLADFNSIQETAYLLGNPANAAHLRESLAQVERGEVVSCSLDEL